MPAASEIVEPLRIVGKAVVNGGSVGIPFDNGRFQRWTPVGMRIVVQHWFPGAEFPTTTPGVLGIGHRAE